MPDWQTKDNEAFCSGCRIHLERRLTEAEMQEAPREDDDELDGDDQSDFTRGATDTQAKDKVE